MAHRWNYSKQVVYETAKRMFIEEGYEVGFRQIAHRLDITPSLISYHFKTKRNIAIEIYKENYALLNGYLKQYVDYKADPVLYLTSFYTLNNLIIENNPDYARFALAVSKENIFLEVSESSGLRQVYLQAVRNMPDNPYHFDEDKRMRLFIVSSFGLYSSIVEAMANGLQLSSEEFMLQAVNYTYFLLGEPFDMERSERMIRAGKEVVDKLLADAPHLLHTHKYLLKNEVSLPLEPATSEK